MAPPAFKLEGRFSCRLIGYSLYLCRTFAFFAAAVNSGVASRTFVKWKYALEAVEQKSQDFFGVLMRLGGQR